MFEELRPLLYYPLGLLPTIFFTLRVLIQWFQSERYQKSYTGKTFWKLSLSGNILLSLHYIVQVQYPFALLQAGNAVISWRNLNLMNPTKTKSTKQTVAIFLTALFALTLIFIAQSYFLIGKIDWIRTPTKLFDTARQHHQLLWHLFGALGSSLFASRFWIQWWRAEKNQRSDLGQTFWWMSIIGSTISLIYFIRIGDNVSIIYSGFGLIPYVRNLMLIKKAQVS